MQLLTFKIVQHATIKQYYWELLQGGRLIAEGNQDYTTVRSCKRAIQGLVDKMALKTVKIILPDREESY